jgi:hypothetical protein
VTEIRLYVERQSGIIYEVQLFDNFVLMRPATVGYESMLRKLSLATFSTSYEEFEGDPKTVRGLRQGEEEIELTVVKR